MRTKLFLAVLAGVALASCVTDKEYAPKQEEQVAVSFASPAMYDNSTTTRAGYHGEIGNHQYTQGGTIYSYPREEDFVIYAVKYPGTITFPGWAGTDVQPALFNGVKADYDPSLDGWVPTKTVAQGEDPYYYWPSGMKLAYAAYSPADLEQESGFGATSYGAAGLKIENFKVPASAANHFDLLFSRRRVDMTKEMMYSGAEKYSGSPIEFQHALTSIHFSLKNESETIVVLKKISLYGVYDTGTFTEGINESKGLGYVRVDSNSENINVTPEWTIADGATTLSKDNAYVAFDANGKRGIEFPENARYISEMMSDEAGKNYVLLVMPQALSGAAKLRIDYNVINGDNTTEAHKVVPLYNAPIYDTQSGAITNNKITSWDIGTKYVYRLVYSKGAAKKDKIYFAPSTEGWKDAGVAVIDLANAEDAQ